MNGWCVAAARVRRPRRPAFGRIRVDPQYVRDRFAEIVKHTPELQCEEPRLRALYVIPLANEEG